MSWPTATILKWEIDRVNKNQTASFDRLEEGHVQHQPGIQVTRFRTSSSSYLSGSFCQVTCRLQLLSKLVEVIMRSSTPYQLPSWNWAFQPIFLCRNRICNTALPWNKNGLPGSLRTHQWEVGYNLLTGNYITWNSLNIPSVSQINGWTCAFDRFERMRYSIHGSRKTSRFLKERPGWITGPKYHKNTSKFRMGSARGKRCQTSSPWIWHLMFVLPVQKFMRVVWDTCHL